MLTNPTKTVPFFPYHCTKEIIFPMIFIHLLRHHLINIHCVHHTTNFMLSTGETEEIKTQASPLRGSSSKGEKTREQRREKCEQPLQSCLSRTNRNRKGQHGGQRKQ